MRITAKLTGARELDRALAEIAKKATAKAVIRRSLIVAAKPMAAAAQDAAPVAEGDLQTSISVGTKLSKRQAKLHRKMFKADRATVEVFIGAGPLSSAHNQEFGNEHHAAQPFMRPAFDAEAEPTINRIGDQMWIEIEKQAKRAARTAARGARGR